MSQSLSSGTKTPPDEWDTNHDYHNELLHEGTDAHRASNVHVQESKNAPLFSVGVARSLTTRIGANPFPQYGLLGRKKGTYNTGKPQEREETDNEAEAEGTPHVNTNGGDENNRIFLNMNAPFSAFLCGSQGSGKSHTLSCMLEGALKDSRAGKLLKPMAGLVFHYDKSSRSAIHQPCEAAFLCSTGIPVRVLVPVSSVHRMEQAYGNLPGLPADAQKPVVCPLLLKEEHLDVTSMMSLMKVDADNNSILYMEVSHLTSQAKDSTISETVRVLTLK